VSLPESLTPVLLCLACRRAVDCPPEAALRYTTAGWPECCGAVMGLYYPAAKPTDLSVPKLAPGAAATYRRA
jgi:hypothetical protein